jgi:hypothetical protein
MIERRIAISTRALTIITVSGDDDERVERSVSERKQRGVLRYAMRMLRVSTAASRSIDAASLIALDRIIESAAVICSTPSRVRT